MKMQVIVNAETLEEDSFDVFCNSYKRHLG